MPFTFLKSPLLWVFILVLVYLINTFTQFSRNRKKIIELQNKLDLNQEVITSSGIYGIIEEIDETSIALRISKDVIIKIDRYHIISIVNK